MDIYFLGLNSRQECQVLNQIDKIYSILPPSSILYFSEPNDEISTSGMTFQVKMVCQESTRKVGKGV